MKSEIRMFRPGYTERPSRAFDLPHWLITTTLLITLIATHVQATTYHLDAATGDDSNSGADWSNAWQTLGRAMLSYGGPETPKVVRGDTVIIKNGNYEGFHQERGWPDYTGDMEEPLPADTVWTTYKTAEGHDQVYFKFIYIRGYGSTPDLVACIFDGMKITDPDPPKYYNAVYFTNAAGLRLQNMVLRGLDPGSYMESAKTRYSVVQLEGLKNNDVKIDNCNVSRGSKGLCICGNNITISKCDISWNGEDKIRIGSGKNVLIEDNLLHAYDPNEKVGHPDCIQIHAPSGLRGITVRGNRMFDHGSQGTWMDNSHIYDMLWENNLIYNVGNNEWTFMNIDGFIFRNNTVVASGYNAGGVRALDAQYGIRNLQSYNNLIIGPYGVRDPASFGYHDYNIFVHVEGQASPLPSEPHSFYYTVGMIDRAEKFAQIARELLVDPDDGDHTLKPGSRGIDFGDPSRGPLTDILGAPRVGRPDAGCYEYGASVPRDTHTLSIAAVHGSVTRTPDKTSYADGETVGLRAVPDTGYSFTGWSGDLSGSMNPTTIVMDGDKSVSAGFTADDGYALNVSAVHGSVSKTPDKTSYSHGEIVTIQALPDSGYTFANWSGDLSGSTNPATVVMDGDKSITAVFTAVDGYVLNVAAIHGLVTITPHKTSYNHGEMVTLQALPDDGYEFAGWSGDLSGTSNPAAIVMDSDKSVTALFTAGSSDTTAPKVTGCSPVEGSIQVSLNHQVALHVVDEGQGVDAGSVTIRVNDRTVYSGNVSEYVSTDGKCRRSGTKAEYMFAYQPNEMFDFDQLVTVKVDAADLAGNAMAQYSYSFETVMREFGENKKVSSNPDTIGEAEPSTTTDSEGNIWSTWHAGPVGARDIYVGELSAQTGRFSDSVRLTTDASDQCNPAIAVGTDDKLYVTWQDNSRGNWDICASTSIDGVIWLDRVRVTDSNDNQVGPAIAVDGASPNRAYIVWQDDRGADQDIYVARSTDGFVTQTLWQVTSGGSDQTDPAMTVDAHDCKYIVWTDQRGGSNDIYGAASSEGPWDNVPIVTKPGSQSSPAIAADPAGAGIHLLWVDETSGNKDIYYAATDGLPSSPLTGSNIVDDSSGADQTAPTIVTALDTSHGRKVFACWQDARYVAGSGDTDLFFAELTPGHTGTNILVGDDGTNADQSGPAIGGDAYGHPYLVWTDNRDGKTAIYYAGNTFIDPVPLYSEDVTASQGATVGPDPATISSVDDVSVVVPAGACLSDTTMTISEIKNPQGFPMQCLSSYDFGPSGIEFAEPVTVTIPYSVTESGILASAYWYDSLTGALSQQGITDIRDIEITPTLHAITFKTTHYTPFYLVVPEDPPPVITLPSGGGCSMAPAGNCSFIEFLSPFIGLCAVMAMLRRRDMRNGKASNAAEGRS
ncbi:MAG: right-handed parallel beta-helix repeat-containing protein [Phycisphaerales bacterium]|nr:MAG: right-handed parallel beta-helix repeat-containing protein [Phycisphaerales bacterium]